MIDHGTYEDTTRKGWRLPDDCERDCNDNQGRDRCSACPGRIWGVDSIPTDFGDLDDTRRSAEGLGLVLVGSVFAGVILGTVLANLWPAILTWGGW